MRTLASGVGAAMLTSALALASTATAAPARCPSTTRPAAGANVNGGLTVDGTCILKGNTINGGLTVAGNGAASLQGGAVHGGIVVQPGGELDVNATTRESGAPTGTTSSVDGGITLDNPFDVDIWTAHINGGLSMTGSFPRHPNGDVDFPTICGNSINGDVTFNDVKTFGTFYFGDPTDNMQFGGKCPGNTINGSLKVTGSSTGEVEGNSVSGSVTLDASKLQFNGNTVGGSLLCKNGTTILAPEPGDPTGNSIGGSNSC